MRNFRFYYGLLLFCLLSGLSIMTMAADPINGGKIYAQQCKNCHGGNGISSFPGAPNLVSNRILLKSDVELLISIRKGVGVMPAFQGLLSDSQTLDVIAYMRSFRR